MLMHEPKPVQNESTARGARYYTATEISNTQCSQILDDILCMQSKYIEASNTLTEAQRKLRGNSLRLQMSLVQPNAQNPWATLFSCNLNTLKPLISCEMLN
jgi:hypothetical protein